MFAFLGPSGNDAIVEVSGNKVNVATRQVDISDISGEDYRLALLTPDSTDGGLRSFAWLRKYLGRLRSFYPKANLRKPGESCWDFCLWATNWGDSTTGTSLPIWAQ